MPFSVSPSPAPLTFTIWPRVKMQLLGAVVDVLMFGWLFYHFHSQFNEFPWVIACLGAVSSLLAIVRRERIEIYPERMRWETFWFGFPWSKEAVLSDVYGIEWVKVESEGKQQDRSHIEFYLPDRTVKAGFTLSYEEYEELREQVRMMYPELDHRWGKARIKSKDLTLLNI